MYFSVGDDFHNAEALLEAVLTMEAQPEEVGVITPTASSSASGPSSYPGTSGQREPISSHSLSSNPNSLGI